MKTKINNMSDSNFFPKSSKKCNIEIKFSINNHNMFKPIQSGQILRSTNPYGIFYNKNFSNSQDRTNPYSVFNISNLKMIKTSIHICSFTSISSNCTSSYQSTLLINLPPTSPIDKLNRICVRTIPYGAFCIRKSSNSII